MDSELYGYKRLKLSVINKTNFRSESGVSLEDDPYWKILRKKILDRDDNQCYFCGFNYPRYMEVHHLNGDWANNSAANLITVCPVCHSCLHIGLAAIQDRGRLLVLNKPIIQSALNRLVLEMASKYAPDREKMNAAIEQIEQAIGVKDDLGETGLQELANMLAAEREANGSTPDVKDNFVFFPNIFKYNMILTMGKGGY